LDNALQIVRCDQSCATGFAPSELLLGRPLVYPVEFNANDVDLTGTEFTVPLVLGLKQIHEKNFSLAHRRIQKNQQKYKQKYDKKNKTKNFNFKVGDRVQYLRYKSKRVLSKMMHQWVPVTGHYLILSIVKKRKTVVLQTPQGKILKQKQPFDRIRKYQGK